MNRSLALKNKLSVYFLFIISFFIIIYLFYFLINGERGVISYFKVLKNNSEYKISLSALNKKNDFYSDRIKRLQTNTIDLDFLDEKKRKNMGFVEKNELLILFD